jgi:hypothetical protein
MARRETSVCNEAAAWPNALEALKRKTRSPRVMRPNEKEISHGRVSLQTHKSHFAIGPLASSIG